MIVEENPSKQGMVAVSVILEQKRGIFDGGSLTLWISNNNSGSIIMTSQITKSIVQPLLLALLAVQGFVLQSAVAIAQEAKDVNVDVDLNTNAPAGGAAWYSAWWIWVLIAVFIIVVVALTTRGGNRNA